MCSSDLLAWLNANWNIAPVGGGWACSGNTYNKGCPYGMFNVFKALKLHGVTTQLSNVNRATGVLGDPVVGDPDDWYMDYVDYLVNNQSSPGTNAGGSWSAAFSGSASDTNGNAALFELILAPVALIAPDPTLFSSVGLKQGSPLSTNDVTGPVSSSHMVTAQVRGTGDVPVPGATVNFTVVSGPNAGASATCVPAS